MSEPRKIRTTSDGCVNEHDVIYLSKRPKIKYKVASYEGTIIRSMTYVMARDRKMLADIITGTLYDPVTGRSNSNNLFLIGPLK